MGERPTILITGAAGNLGGLLARSLVSHAIDLRLMAHRTPVPAELAGGGDDQLSGITAEKGKKGKREKRLLICEFDYE